MESYTSEGQAFESFYDTYAPKLWGLILKADLPALQSESILLNTLTKAWLQRDLEAPTQPHFLTRLIGLACREGLPVKCLPSNLTSKFRFQ
jgi:hypothetical protein